MNFGISTLKKFLCTLSIGMALMVGMSIEAQAQRHRGSPPYGRAYGYRHREARNAAKFNRKALRRDLRLHQKGERRALNARLRNSREVFGNSREWRYRQRQERGSLRLHQRQERVEWKQRVKNRKHWKQ